MITINKDRLVAEFFDLVKVDSETKYEANIAQILREKFQQLGCDVIEDATKQQTGHGAGNIICTLEGSLSHADPIFFTAHMDTVAPGCGVKPMMNDGYITSDGTTILGADDKAGIAAMLEAIKTLQEQHIKHGHLQFIITVGEELGLIGAKALDPSLIQASFGYVLDSSGPVGDIVIAAPTQARLRVLITHKEAQPGSVSKQGISAINVATKALSKIPLGRIDEETTAKISSFAGGKQTNIVWDHVEILGEARSLRRDKLDKQINKMKEVFISTAHQFGASAHVQVDIMYPSFSYQPDDHVVEVARVAALSIGRESRFLKSDDGSDANIFANYGIPTVNLAIGYEHIHTTRERISIVELVKISELVTAIINRVATMKQ